MRAPVYRTACVMTVLALVGCRDTTLVPPRSLDSPSAMAVARGDVCLTTFEDADRVLQYDIAACDGDERGAIALITNEQSDRLALMDLNAQLPRLVDLDPTTPGPNHLEVGRLPVDVAASPDGRCPAEAGASSDAGRRIWNGVLSTMPRMSAEKR